MKINGCLSIHFRCKRMDSYLIEKEPLQSMLTTCLGFFLTHFIEQVKAELELQKIDVAVILGSLTSLLIKQVTEQTLSGKHAQTISLVHDEGSLWIHNSWKEGPVMRPGPPLGKAVLGSNFNRDGETILQNIWNIKCSWCHRGQQTLLPCSLLTKFHN